MGQNIRSFRKQKGYTQERLAELCNITPVFVSQIENGMRKPSLETVFNISKILTVTVDELLNAKTDTAHYIEAIPILLATRTDNEVHFCYDIVKKILENMDNGEIRIQSKPL